MATVYKAQQLCPGRLVAVKVIDRSLADDGEIVPRFRQEQALGARLRHPNLTAVYQAGRAAGRPYLVMEYGLAVGVVLILLSPPRGTVRDRYAGWDRYVL